MARANTPTRHAHTGVAARATSIVAVIALALALLAASSAQAAYQQATEHFGVSGEAEQLRHADSMAVNVSGAGLPAGEAGSIYAVGRNARVVRYGPGAEGQEPPFREAWGWKADASEPKAEFQRCGPAVEDETGKAAHCAPAEPNAAYGGEQPGHFNEPGAVAVDQATGDVYVLNGDATEHREHHLIEVFTPTGTPVGEGFGDGTPAFPAPAESIAESAEKLHEMLSEELGLAVDEAGVVYVTDRDHETTIASPPGESRVMSFEPEHPGNYEHYVYAPGKDITTANSKSKWFMRIALVPGGRLVAASSEFIREYPVGGGSTPLCTYKVSGGELFAMTANPVSGEVFYFNTAKKVHRLGPCDTETEKFEEIQEAVSPTPETDTMRALALNPSLSWGAHRPAGVLYGADAEVHSSQLGIGDVFVPAEVHPPVVKSQSVSTVGSGVATFGAQVNPEGSNTNFVFQYLSESSFETGVAVAEREGKSGAEAEAAAFVGALETPAGGSFLGSGSTVLSAAASVSGLVPEMEYRFRVLATSHCNPEHAEEACEDAGPATAFRTFPVEVAGLPDGRAYELVSPAQKFGGEVFPAEPITGSCYECKPPDGSGLIAVFPMQSAPDGEAVAYEGFPFSSTEGSAVLNSYISRRTASGWQTTAMSPSLQATGDRGTLAYDSGLEHGLISQGEPQLSPRAPAGYRDLYLQDAADPSALSPLLTVKPEHRSGGLGFVLEYAGHSADFKRQFFAANDSLTGASAFAPEPSDPGSVGRDLYEWNDGGLALVNVLPGNSSVASGAAFASTSPDTHAVSENGRRVFWTAGSVLYAREDGEVTREVRDPGHFITASPDGSRVLLSDGCLYSLATESCIDLTGGQGGFQGVAGNSDDLSRVYFVDTTVLVGSGENERHETAQTGQDNLYFWEEGAPARFITTLSAQDGGAQHLNDWIADPAQRTAEASPDGRWLAFGSNITSTCPQYNNTGELVPQTCREVFVYEAAGARMRCVSCNPAGEAPRGTSTLTLLQNAQEWLPQPRYLTNQGRVFFDSQERLSTLDTNGRVEDVYEFEPAGVGSCVRAGGCVVLISPGTGTVDSDFVAMDETGKNVFFTTRERLVAQDTDELIDLYDAREGGGFPSETETREGECQGEACQSTPVPPVFQTPGSTTFSGLGNFLAPATPAVTAAAKPKAKKKTLTRAEKLAQALQACRRKHSKGKRVACEKHAGAKAHGAVGKTRHASTGKKRGVQR